MMKKLISLALLAGVAASCVNPGYRKAEGTSESLEIYPDYTGTVVPVNIAPLNFDVITEADACVVEIEGANSTLVLKGPGIRIPEKKWKKMLAETAGSSLEVRTFLKKDGSWKAFGAFGISVAPEEIENYLTYRLIEPGYSNYGYIVLRQRDLTSFKENDLYNNALISQRVDQQCINCHSFQNYNADRFQFHARHTSGGTIVVKDGEGKKLEFKEKDLISNAVYPSWHPQQNLIAYSVNNTMQIFQTHGNQKTEVFDGASDLILYDADTDEVSYIVHDSLALETFPYWAADGKTLYYASAYLPDFGADSSTDLTTITDKIRYNIWSVGFDPQSRTFGTPSLIFDAAADSLSAVTPRPSPDGRYLLFGVGDFGSFHVWHETGDIYITDLSTGETRPLDELNSDRAESFKSWSSNSRWIAFTSRREDGSYTRVYFSYFDSEGKAHKPFLLPQRDPQQNHRFFRSYNVPEFSTDRTSWTPKRIERIVRSEAVHTRLTD